MSSSRSRGAFSFLVRVAIFMLVFGVVTEVWFRTVMPAAEVPLPYQQAPSTVVRFDPYRLTSGLNTVGRLCLHGAWWHVNSAGWNSDVNYVSAADRHHRPLIALFGDSYVEGLLSDADKHIDAYLPRMLPGTSCYAFGGSGWYLEQYVAVSRYVRARFQPDVLVVMIDGGDVADSLRSNGVRSPYWWQIGSEGASFHELAPTAEYVASRKAVLSRKSALINYLRFNAGLSLPGMHNAAVPEPASVGGQPGDSGGASPTSPSADAWRQLLPAADFMVGRLCADNPGTPIVFVANDARYLPVQDIARTALAPDIEAIRVASRSRPQCSFLDTRYAFSRDWAAHHVRFEAADGDHWNAYANRLVARTLANFISENKLLPRQK